LEQVLVPRLISILAASIGGGLMLGAGIRLAEAMAAQDQVPQPDKLAERIGDLESRVLTLEAQKPTAIVLEESVASRMAEVEIRVQEESARSRKETVDAIVESVQTRVVQRISRLEEEVAAQSAAMSELRDCSLRTERSLQRLLGGLERLIVKDARQPEPGSGGAHGSNPQPRSEASPPNEAKAAEPEVSLEYEYPGIAVPAA
jgi:hypothetical protein